MTRLAADSVNGWNLPYQIDGQPVAIWLAYANGDYASSLPVARARAQGQAIGSICVNAADIGDILDVERYDATPQQAAGWVQARRAVGVDPSVYCSLSTWPQVQQVFADANVAPPHYWVAAYPGPGIVVPAGAVAHQYQDAGAYDATICLDYWPGIDPPPLIPTDKEYEVTDSAVAPNGDIVSHAVTLAGHYLEITRKAGTQGEAAPGNVSVIDLTAWDPQLVVEP